MARGLLVVVALLGALAGDAASFRTRSRVSAPVSDARGKTRQLLGPLSSRKALLGPRRRRTRELGRLGIATSLALAQPAFAADLFATDLSFLGEAALTRDCACAMIATIGATAWVKLVSMCARAGLMPSKVSRKVVHCGSAPLFLLVWPCFSASAEARWIAAAVPVLNLARVVLASADGDSDIVKAVSRTGDRMEVLGGPTIYCIVLILSTALWRESAAAIVAISQMAVGDGLADIVGRKFGENNKWSFNPSKSKIGSFAFAAGAGVATLGLFAWYIHWGLLPQIAATTLPVLVAKVAFVSIACALVEIAPQKFLPDDNISVPLVAAILGFALFGS